MIFHQIRIADRSHIRCKKSTKTILLAGISSTGGFLPYVFWHVRLAGDRGFGGIDIFKYKSL